MSMVIRLRTGEKVTAAGREYVGPVCVNVPNSLALAIVKCKKARWPSAEERAEYNVVHAEMRMRDAVARELDRRKAEALAASVSAAADKRAAEVEKLADEAAAPKPKLASVKA